MKFSKIVTVQNGGDLGLLLETGTTDRTANYVSGSGTDSLRFDYTVQAGDNSADLNVHNPAALSVGATGTIQDGGSHNAILTLPGLGDPNGLAAQKAIVVDTTNPSDPSSVGFSGTFSNSTSFALSFAESTDSNFLNHSVKICTQNDCTTGCNPGATTLHSPVTMTGVNGTSYYACVSGNDALGLTSNWVASLSTITIDTTAPTITNVSSTTADGYYKTGDTINVRLTFSESVIVTNPADVRILMETGSTDHDAVYASGSGTNTLNFSYTVQNGDGIGDLNVQAASALTLGAGGSIKDAAGNNADLTLPAAGAGSLSHSKTIVLDTTAPNAPTAVAFSNSSPSSVTNLALAWTDGSDSNFRRHNLKLCTANDCSTACLAPINDTASPGSLVGADGGTYYACIRSEDMAGLASAWVASPGSMAITATNPTVISVSATSANGYYSIGDTISITVQFSRIVNVTNGADLSLLLETGTTDRTASYVSGSGTDTLRFDYTVQPNDVSVDLNVQNTAALSVGATGTIKDAALFNADLTLPEQGDSNSLASQKAIIVDTTNPPDPSAVAFAGSLSGSLSFPMSFTESSDLNLLNHDVKLCTQNDCATGCTSASTTVFSPATMTGIDGMTYYGCVRAHDAVSLTSNWVASASTITVDTTGPTVTNITSTTADNYYKVGDSINVRVTFSEAVTVTNSADIHILMETGASDRNANYTSGNGTNALHFTYTVQSGDTSGDLNIKDANALTLGATGAIKDAAGNNVSLALPAAGAGSLSDSNAIVIDTTAPSTPSSVAFSSSPSLPNMSLSWVDSTDTNFSTHNVKICTNNLCTSGCIGATTDPASPSTLVGVHGTSYYGCVQGHDLAGQTSNWVASTTAVTVDGQGPTIHSVSSSTADGSHKIGDVITLTIQFSEIVVVSNPGDLRLRLETGSTDRDAIYSSGTGTNTLTFAYTVQSGDTAGDLDYASNVALTLGVAGRIKDGVGNDASLTLPNPGANGSLSFGKALLIDGIAPTISTVTSHTTNGSYGQGLVIDVRVTFSKSVTVTGTPSVALNTSPSHAATYASGSGTTELIFNYTIQSGDMSADLNYAATNSLALNSGTIRDSTGNDADLTLPALAAAESLGGGKNIDIAGTSTPPSLVASPASQNVIQGNAITSVNVNHNPTGNDLDGESQAITYTCVYDTAIDGTMTAGGSSCASLPNTSVSFNAATGILAWTPSTAAVLSYTAISNYEFAVTGSDSTHLSHTVYFTVSLLKPNSGNWPFTAGTSASYTFDPAKIDFSGGYVRLQQIDQIDDDDDSAGFSASGVSMKGLLWDSTNNYLRLGNAGGCDATSGNCSSYDSSWIPWSSLVNHFPLENNLIDAKSAAVVSGANPPSFGSTRKIGTHAASFDGSNDAFNWPRTISDDFSITLWLKTNQSVTEGSCIRFYEGPALVVTGTSSTANNFGVSYCNSKIIGGVGNSSVNVVSRDLVKDDKWHFVAFTRVKSTGLIALYVDGLLQGTATGNTASLTASATLYAGNVSGDGNYYSGLLDEIGIWNASLTAEQISSIYARQAAKFSGQIISRIIDTGASASSWTGLEWKSALPTYKELPDHDGSVQNESSSDYSGLPNSTLMTGLVGLFHFNETVLNTAGGSGEDFRDDSSSLKHGSISGTSGTDFTLGVNGVFGKGVQFKSTGSAAINLGNISTFDFGPSGSFSVQAWAKWNQSGDETGRIMHTGVWGGSTGWVMYNKMENANGIGFAIGCGNHESTCVMAKTTNSNFNDGRFHHIVARVDGTNKILRIYVDGIQQNVTKFDWGNCGTIVNGNQNNYSSCSTANANHSGNTYIGKHPNGNPFEGVTDEIAIWNRALSDAEIKALYRRGANRIKYQVMGCANADCSDGSWKGIDGTHTSYFSELNNNSIPATMTGNVKKEAPSLTFSSFSGTGLTMSTSRYFRYRGILESDDEQTLCNYGAGAVSCSPELQSLTITPIHYDGSVPTIVSSNPINFYNLSSFSETLGAAGCPGTVKYQLSVNGANWFYWNGTIWSTSDSSYAEANTASEINTNAASFGDQVGRNTVFVKAHLKSNGAQACELDQLAAAVNGQF